jgi:hypothetical protein
VTDTPLDEIPARVERVRRTFESGVTKPLAWRHAQVHSLREPWVWRVVTPRLVYNS